MHSVSFEFVLYCFGLNVTYCCWYMKFVLLFLSHATYIISRHSWNQCQLFFMRCWRFILVSGLAAALYCDQTAMSSLPCGRCALNRGIFPWSVTWTLLVITVCLITPAETVCLDILYLHLYSFCLNCLVCTCWSIEVTSGKLGRIFLLGWLGKHDPILLN